MLFHRQKRKLPKYTSQTEIFQFETNIKPIKYLIKERVNDVWKKTTNTIRYKQIIFIYK